jgi:hypothetical protein
VTRSDSSDYAAWYPYVASNLFTDTVPTPAMPWRDAATATEGTLYGQITDWTTGEPVDDATVQVGALDAVQTDGNGYYVVTLIPASGAGTAYDVSVSASGLPSAVRTGVTVHAGGVDREDIALGETPPTIELDAIAIETSTRVGLDPPAETFNVRNAGGGTLNYVITDDAAWLEALPGQGTSTGEADPIDVGFAVAGLGVGVHYGTIEVADPAATNSPQSVDVTLTVKLPGDFDNDGDVDHADFGHIQLCLSGDTVPQPLAACREAKFDGDSDVDDEDVALFVGCMSGAGVPADAGCLN